MGAIMFDVKLAVEIKDGFLKATLLFINNTSTKLYLDGMTLCCNNRIERNVFSIFDKRNNKISYTGMMVKRVLVPEDFIQLSSGDQFKFSVILNEAYRLNKGDQYIIQYSAFNPGSYDPQDTTIIKMESNKVEIDYQ